MYPQMGPHSPVSYTHLHLEYFAGVPAFCPHLSQTLEMFYHFRLQYIPACMLIVGLPASIFACRKMSIGAFAGNVVPYKFPVLEMGLFILVLFGMELILSVWTIRRQKKQSLIEQMRAME